MSRGREGDSAFRLRFQRLTIRRCGRYFHIDVFEPRRPVFRFLLFVFSKLLLQLMEGAVQGRRDRARFFPGHEIGGVFRRDAHLDLVGSRVGNINRHMHRCDAVQITRKFSDFFPNALLCFGA